MKVQLLKTNNLQVEAPTNQKPSVQISFRDSLQELCNSIERDFSKSQNASKDLIRMLPVQYRSVIQTQIQISELQYKVEMMTRLADGLQQTIKKLQQQN